MSAEPGLPEKVELLERALSKAGIGHAFGGALALAYYATPRATVDIDVNVFVPVEEFERVMNVLRGLGVTRIPDPHMVRRDGQARTWWGRNPVDVFFSYDAIHEAMAVDARTVPFGTTTIPIIAPEHLMVVKAVFDRPKDWIDIEQMLVAVDVLHREEISRSLTHLVGTKDARYRRMMKLFDELRGRD